LPLNKARFGSAVSRTAKLRFPFLLLLSPRIAFGIRTMNFVKTLKRNVVFFKKNYPTAILPSPQGAHKPSGPPQRGLL
jgi:hypothetical protein